MSFFEAMKNSCQKPCNWTKGKILTAGRRLRDEAALLTLSVNAVSYRKECISNMEDALFGILLQSKFDSIQSGFSITSGDCRRKFF